MTTDYGLKCLDCNESCVQDGVSKSTAVNILSAVHPLVNLREITNVIGYLGLDVDLSAC